jgi:hypothetical protein
MISKVEAAAVMLSSLNQMYTFPRLFPSVPALSVCDQLAGEGLAGCGGVLKGDEYCARLCLSLSLFFFMSLSAPPPWAYQAQISKKFTALATITLPLSLVAGLFGMNVTVPGQAGSIAWWWGITGAMAILAIVLLIIFRYRGLF